MQQILRAGKELKQFTKVLIVTATITEGKKWCYRQLHMEESLHLHPLTKG